MPGTDVDWIEVVSEKNWPAARVRNVVKAFEEERARQWMPMRNPPPKRMPREKALEWLATTAGIPLDDLKLTRPVQFVQQYVMGSCEQHALVKAVRIVHGVTTNAMYAPADKDCAPEWMLGHARQQVLAKHHAPAVVVVPEIAPAPAPAPVEAGDGYEVYPHRELVNTDADDHLFEPPPVPLPTMAEVAERLVSLGERVEAHAEEVEIAEQRRFEDRAALNRLSDRLVSSEMELGLIDDALDHMYAGQQSPANVVGRLAAIIARITAMDI
jgi:hypothetical protein